MFRFSIRELFSHKIRFLLTTFSVLVGVSFVVGSFVLTASVRAQFDNLFTEINSGIDLTVRAEQKLESGPFGATPSPVPESLAEEIRALDGVERAEGTLQFFPALPIQDDGDPLASMGGPPLGINWVDAPGVSALEVVEGTAPGADGEIALDIDAADRGGFAVGDTIAVQTPVGAADYELVGTFRFGESNALSGATLMAFTTAEAQRLASFPDAFQTIDIAVADGADTAAVEAEIAALLPDGIEVIPTEEVVAEAQADLGELFDIFATVLLVFAGVTLFVSAFLINNTFTILVGQRVKELALLRAIGASPRQVFGSVLTEAGIIGIVASVGGFLLGLLAATGLNAILNAAGFGAGETTLVIEPVSVVAAVGVGLGITLLSSLLPAWQATTVPPVAAMRDDFTLTGMSLRARGIVGAVITLAGVGLLGAALLSGESDVTFWASLGIGAILVFLGVAGLSPLFAAPVSRGIGWPFAALSHTTGGLARENAARNPRRTSSTAAALMIGLALVSMALVVGTSIKESFANTLESSITADWYMSEATGFVGFTPDVAAQLAELPELSAVTGLRQSAIGVDGTTKQAAALDLSVTDQLFELDVVEGGFDPAVPNALLLGSDPAADLGVGVGDTVEVTFEKTGPQPMVVTGVYDDTSVVGNWLMDIDFLAANSNDQVDVIVAARTAEGVDEAAARAAIDGVLSAYPQVELQSREEFQASQEQQLDTVLIVVNVFLGFSIVIAFLGIANTLALSVFERTREIGLLRAVGMVRRQLRRMVRYEAVVVSVYGAVLGVVVGLAFGLAVTSALPEDFINQIAVPWGQLVVIVAISGLLGVVAALFPAWRASRLDVLRALTVE